MKIPTLHASWQGALGAEFEKPYFQKLSAFVDKERAAGQVFPPEDEVFTALQHTPLDAVRVVILGQDPYHDVGQAHGLSFSVKPGVASPPSLMNMYKELKADLGCKIPNNGYLMPWADQGVLMLNAVLTVKAHTPNSHKDQGWEQFTDAVVRAINDRAAPAVFLLWAPTPRRRAR
jgi:uracil-DNA glycosylase